MANICENELQIHVEDYDNLTVITKFFKEIGADIDDVGDNDIVVYFDSKWDFPEEQMNELYKSLPNKDDVDMTCLSVEWGNYYCAFHTCNSEGWVLQN